VVGLLLLGGCGGGSSDPAAGSSYSSARDVADAIGCTSYTAGARQVEIPVKGAPSTFRFETGTCSLGAERLTVMWSTGADAAFTYVFRLGRAPKQPLDYLHDAGWLVHCAHPDTCTAVRDVIGGTLGNG
jgi:hypothetical protein